MALVTIGTIYTNLNIGSIMGKPVDMDPLLYSRIQQEAIEPFEDIICDVDLSVIVQGSVPNSLEDSSGA
jgi:CO dehydrogenase/acetyl-CoA synthase delta subunit